MRLVKILSIAFSYKENYLIGKAERKLKSDNNILALFIPYHFSLGNTHWVIALINMLKAVVSFPLLWSVVFYFDY